MRSKVLLVAAALAGSASLTQAAEGRFIHPADTNKDDRIEKSEWVAYGLPAADFAKADKDGDQKINGPEFVAYNASKKPPAKGE